MNRWIKRVTIVSGLLAAINPVFAGEEVNLYSARKEKLIKPLLDQFTTETGIKVNLVTSKAKILMKRLQSEGRNTPADLLITVDAGNLHAAKQAGLLQPVKSDVLERAIPEHLRDPDGHWFALSARSRVIVYSKERVNPDQLSSYENLTDSKWKNRICIRSSNNIYNQSLLASLIAHNGPAKAEQWARGVVANMARRPQGNDRAQVMAVAAGVCDIAVINSYYMGRMLTNQKEADQQQAAQQVAIFIPNQSDRGAHINVSGIGIVAGSRNRENAQKLMEFLAGDEAQRWYASANHEYPVKQGIPVSSTVNAWGYPFNMDKLMVSALGENNTEAVKIFDRAGWK